MAIYIDEYVRALFRMRPGESFQPIKNEYPEILQYLQKIERLRRLLPVPFYVIKFWLKRSVYITLRFFKLVPPLRN
jgi:hypothetical protein